MTLHDHIRCQRDLQFVLQVRSAGFFGFTAAIGKEDEWYTLFLEVGEGFVRARDGVGGADEDAVDAKRGSVCCFFVL